MKLKPQSATFSLGVVLRLGLACCLALGLQSAAFAQAVAAAASPYDYVTLVATNGGGAYLDYGQTKDLGKQAPTTELEKDFVAVQTLQRAMLALNYLSSKGWEYVGMSGRERSSGSTSSGSFALYTSTEYLLRRPRR